MVDEYDEAEAQKEAEKKKKAEEKKKKEEKYRNGLAAYIRKINPNVGTRNTEKRANEKYTL